MWISLGIWRSRLRWSEGFPVELKSVIVSRMQQRDQKYEAFNDRLNALSDEEISAREHEHFTQTARDFADVCDALKKSKCHYCQQPISYFVESKPYFHWLLKPNGFKKKHFPKLFEQTGFRRLNTYLRWIANSEKTLQNINDLKCESHNHKFIEESIKYREFEWSFSCAESDRAGHSGSRNGSMPHFHFQMRINGNAFIDYTDFHIPFTDYDHFSFAVEEGRFERLIAHRTFDAGMQTLFDANSDSERLVDSLRYTKDEENAALHTEFILMAEPGHTISGDEIAAMFEERERTGTSFGVLARKLKNVSVEAYVSAGPGVPEKAVRKSRGSSPEGNSGDTILNSNHPQAAIPSIKSTCTPS